MQSVPEQRRDQMFPKLDPVEIERVRRCSYTGGDCGCVDRGAFHRRTSKGNRMVNLNEHTSEDLALYAVEIELWQIDTSKPALRFNVLSQPTENGIDAEGVEPR
jgi:hypothetical protein